MVTGSGGFVGQHVVDALKKNDAHVVGVTRHPHNTDEIAVNIFDKKSLNHIIKKFSPTIIYHLASDALVEQGQSEPYKTFTNNIISSLNVLELGRKYNCSRIIMASSVHVYGNQQMPYKESNPARPSRPYETSKTCVDLIAQSYADSFTVPVLIPRFVNIFGPGDVNFTRIIPKTIKSVLFHNNPEMWGGSAKREYLYIDDAVGAYLKLAQVPDNQFEKNRIYNFGTGEPVSVSDLIHTIIRLGGYPLSVKRVNFVRPEELLRQIISWEKARRVLDWKPRISLDLGLVKTMAWYKQYFRLQ